ncbi:MAG: NAD(P)H-quinone oxidoreductase [Acidobacteriota bacterium]
MVDMLAVVPEATAEGPAPCLRDAPDPAPGPGELAIAVRATALNQADLLQLRGHYPPPPGESDVPGLECAGVVAELGEGTGGFRLGDRVMALLGGGGHATRAVAPVGQVMPLPENLSFAEGAALPEACLTAWTNLVVEGGLRPGETVLVTGATGGMGTMAVQIARELGALVVAAGRSATSLQALAAYGIEKRVILDGALVARVLAVTGDRGVDLVFDLVGGPYLPRLLETLAIGGRLVLVGLSAGARSEIDLRVLLHRRLRLVGSVLRPRSRAEKAALVAGFGAFGLPRLADGRLRPVVAEVLPFQRVAEAYRRLQAGGVAGKVVLTLEP